MSSSLLFAPHSLAGRHGQLTAVIGGGGYSTEYGSTRENHFGYHAGVGFARRVRGATVQIEARYQRI
jgi:hypothetical protein